MTVPSAEILLVTPVWNDSSLLAGFGAELAKALADSPLSIEWIIADDGSNPQDHAPIEKLKAAFGQIFPRVQLHFAARHYGKGAVVREARALHDARGMFVALLRIRKRLR